MAEIPKTAAAKDAFDTLGVDARFDLDPGELERRHRELSRALHPDRYAGAPAAERRMALGRAIEVNEAYRVLRDPVKRAEALLRRGGVAVGEVAEPKASPELLMEFMERREELSDAARAKDLAAVGKLAAVMRARQAETLRELAAALASPAEELAAALPKLGELRYVRRFLEEVSAIEESLEQRA
jgi:molecular chaperone HscB